MGVLKVGLVGIGAQMQQNLLPALLQTPDIDIVGACDSEAARVCEIHRFIPNIATTDSVSSMLDSMSVDAMVIACEPYAQREISMRAMQRGIGVFVERPPCSTLGELRSLVDMARQCGVRTGVGMNLRFSRPVRQLLELAMSEAFGDTSSIQLTHYVHQPHSASSERDRALRSFLLGQALQTIDLAVTFGGGELVDVQSRVQRTGEALIVEAECTFSSGAIASLLLGTTLPHFEFQMKLFGSTSTMAELDDRGNVTVHGAQPGSYSESTAQSPLDFGPDRGGYESELHRFFEACRTRTRFEADFRSLLATYRIVEAICEADGATDSAIDSERDSAAMAEKERYSSPSADAGLGRYPH
ncbi:Gfo/Idh/MocA family oxidoreductase [Trinickia sp. NRRL B-1857]|uniref:Gfo/Idh/MocA family protein n=1 Tax=Trinickia sp. NRRL B-1857 TaxID=3162879 RepID=UPI003D2C2F3F